MTAVALPWGRSKRDKEPVDEIEKRLRSVTDGLERATLALYAEIAHMNSREGKRDDSVRRRGG